jgi:general secretion pathway protein M
MIERFQQLERRQQIVLTLGAVLAVILIGWLFVWTPLQTRSAELTDAVADKSELVVELRRAAGLNTTGPLTGSAAGANSSLTVVINLAAQPLGLESAIESSSPVGGGDAIRVSLRGAPFDTLVNWLDTLERQHGVAVATVNIARANQPGLVNGQIVLERT